MNRLTALAGIFVLAGVATAQNLPPIPINLPPGNTFPMNAGDLQVFSLDFGSPETGQTTDIAVNTYGQPGFSFTVTPGNTANVSGLFTSDLHACGSHAMTLTVTDDGGAPGDTTIVDVFFQVNGLFTLTVGQPAGLGSVQIENLCGNPGEMYFMAVTDDQNNIVGCSKCGWWFGMFIPMSELVAEFVSQSPPFVGTLDAMGNSFWSAPPGTFPPHNWYCFAKSVTFDPTNYFLDLVTTTVPFWIY